MRTKWGEDEFDEKREVWVVHLLTIQAEHKMLNNTHFAIKSFRKILLFFFSLIHTNFILFSEQFYLGNIFFLRFSFQTIFITVSPFRIVWLLVLRDINCNQMNTVVFLSLLLETDESRCFPLLNKPTYNFMYVFSLWNCLNLIFCTFFNWLNHWSNMKN